MAGKCAKSWITRVGSDSTINGLKTIFKDYFTNMIVVNVAKPWGGTMDMYLSLGGELTKFDPDGSGSYFSATWKDVWVTSSGTAVEVEICKFTAPVVEETPTGEIGSISHQIHEEIGEDEITFEIPVKNTSGKPTYNYIQLYDVAGKKLEREPDTYKYCSAGGTIDIVLSSRWKFWSIKDVQGQTVTFKLFSSFSRLSGYDQADAKSYSVAVYEEKPPVEPPVEEKPTGEIWPVSHQIHEEIGKDEITFTIPVTNTSGKTTVNYVKLYNDDGEEIERQPYFSHTYESIGAGNTFDFELSSKWRLWSIEDVQGRTVTFKLFSAFSELDVKQLVDTQTYLVEAYEEEPPVDPCEGVVCEPVCVGVDLYRQSCVDGKCGPDLLFEENAAACGYVAPYEPPVEPPIEPPVEPPVEPPTDEEDDVLMYIALFAIAYIMFSNG